MAQLTPTPPPAENLPPVAHALEADVRRELLAENGLNFSSLVVRRVADGVCLEGVLEVFDDDTDVIAAALRIAGVDQVQNHLLIRHAGAPGSTAGTAQPKKRRPR